MAAAMSRPSLPPPVAVRLKATETVVIVLDVTDPLCVRRPSCVASVPRIATLLSRARTSGAKVMYSLGPTGPTSVIAAVAPQASEPVFSGRADKFFGTTLDDMLRSAGARILVLVGTSTNGAVLYTSYGANLRGYTVVVAADAVSSDDELTTEFALWQLLHQPGLANPDNDPAAEGRVIVSTTEWISFD